MGKLFLFSLLCLIQDSDTDICTDISLVKKSGDTLVVLLWFEIFGSDSIWLFSDKEGEIMDMALT